MGAGDWSKKAHTVMGLCNLIFVASQIMLELASCFIDPVHATVWAGFWTGIIGLVLGIQELCMGK